MSWRYFPPNSKPYDLPVDYNQTSENFEFSPNLVHTQDKADKFPEEISLENFYPVDGRHGRRIITINRQFPGPVIRVMRGSKVIVRIDSDFFYFIR